MVHDLPSGLSRKSFRIELPKLFPEAFLKTKYSEVRLTESPMNLVSAIVNTFEQIYEGPNTIYSILPNSEDVKGAPCFDFLETRGANEACRLLSKDCDDITNSIQPNELIVSHRDEILQKLKHIHDGVWHALHLKVISQTNHLTKSHDTFFRLGAYLGSVIQ